MARTMKYLERKAMEAYAKFADDPYCDECPLGDIVEWEEWKHDLKSKVCPSIECEVCRHFFKFKDGCSCPCYNIGPEKALAMLHRYVKKWRKEGLIK